MKILVDANVLLDVICKRENFFTESKKVWTMCEENELQGFISALSVPNIIYIMRHILDPLKTDEVVAKLATIFEIADLKASDLIYAAQMRNRDFEDAVQIITAERIHADYIVTRNTQDFSSSRIPALEPAKLLEKL